MRALTSVGEVGIETGGRSYLLRPSLFSMTQIGQPTTIVETTAILLSPEPDDPFLLKRFRKARFERALDVMYACAGEQDLGDLIGGMVPTGKGRIAYSRGIMPMADIVAIAQALIRHGVMGDVEPEPGRIGEAMTEFKATDYVAAAIAHLGMSESDAWGMTMTSFVQVMRSKYPPKPGPKPMTANDVDANLARLAKINALRAGKK
jgi:hypothetical protein